MQVETDEAGEREVLLAHPVVGAVDPPVEREDQRDGVLRDGVRGVGGHPRHRDAQPPRLRQVDVVESGTPERHVADARRRQSGEAVGVDPVVHERTDRVGRRGGPCGLGGEPKLVEEPGDAVARDGGTHALSVVRLRVVEGDGGHAADVLSRQPCRPSRRRPWQPFIPTTRRAAPGARWRPPSARPPSCFAPRPASTAGCRSVPSRRSSCCGRAPIPAGPRRSA